MREYIRMIMMERIIFTASPGVGRNDAEAQRGSKTAAAAAAATDRFPTSSLSPGTRLILVYDTAAGRCLGEYPPDSLSTQLYNPLSNWLTSGPP